MCGISVGNGRSWRLWWQQCRRATSLPPCPETRHSFLQLE
ncbi:hypothetical protein HMPREF9603_02135 [Cutibacterium acnes HL001PA1]|nr:hypothetical protein HMPREF9603_02135 [Cutibacterium acnes HL001PA1]